MKQRIGPLPLLGGLQTQPAQGKATGLLRMLNMESRDGLCQTRRGSSLRHVVLLTPGAGPAFTKSPASWAAQTVVGLGFVATDVQGFEGAPLYVLFQGGDANTTPDEGVIVEFFGADLAWHTLLTERIGALVTGMFAGASTDTFQYLQFTIPYGWINDAAGFGSVKCWLRITFAGALSADMSIQTSFANRDTALLGARTRMLAIDARGTELLLYATPVKNNNTGIQQWLFGRTPDAGQNFAGINSRNLVPATYVSIPSFDYTPLILYMPATNEALIATEDAYWVGDPRGASSSFAALVISPPDERYADIATEDALPFGPAAGCIFGGRPFIGGFISDPSLLIWGAPLAFWKTWPSANNARVSSGRIVAMVPVDQTLYIFTTTSIWRAVLGDPSAGNESNLFIDLVEETGCAAGATVVTANKRIVFLANDGVRVLDGIRSKSLTDDVRDLFRPDSEHGLACLMPESACAAWHPIENAYYLAYRSPGAPYNDTMMVIRLDDGTVWLWGDTVLSALETGVITPALGPIGQRRRSIRATSLAYDRQAKRIVGIDPTGIVFELGTGRSDLGQAIAWHAETHNLRMARGEEATLQTVEVQALRDNFASIMVNAIPDGDRARLDPRTITIEPDRIDTTQAIGAANLGGNMTPLQLDASIAPYRARFRKSARNHRVRIESVAPNHDPVAILALNVEFAVADRHR